MSLYTHITIRNNGWASCIPEHNYSSTQLRNASADQCEKFWAEEVQAMSMSHRRRVTGTIVWVCLGLHSLHIIFLKPLFGNSLA